MNKFEQIKAEKDGLAADEDICRYADTGWQAITDDDKVRLKWHGVFFRKRTPGHFMLRIRIPNGIASTAQVRAITGIAKEWGRDLIDITTRQQIQLRWFQIEHVPEMLARLAAVGLTSKQTGMDNIRNVVGCPLAGLTGHELFDASPAVREFTGRFVGNLAFTNLPRKYNVAITACLDHCLHVESQDLSLTPAVRYDDGVRRLGFNVRVGGKQGSGGYRAASSLDMFVLPEEAADVCEQITLLFRDFGCRETRSRARLAFLVEEWGIERFRAEVVARLGRDVPTAGRDMGSHHQTDHLGLTPQETRGLYTVGLLVPVGRLSGTQLEEAARLADLYGSGELRFTTGQNVIIPGVSDEVIVSLLAEPLLTDLRPNPSAVVRGTVSCTGTDFCDLALADTKSVALRVARSLDRAGVGKRPISVHWSGCPAACGNHHLADIGLQGNRARIGGEVIETFHVFVGGRSGPMPRAGACVLEDVPAAEIEGVIGQLVTAHNHGIDLVEAGRALAAERLATVAAPCLAATVA